MFLDHLTDKYPGFEINTLLNIDSKKIRFDFVKKDIFAVESKMNLLFDEILLRNKKVNVLIVFFSITDQLSEDLLNSLKGRQINLSDFGNIVGSDEKYEDLYCLYFDGEINKRSDIHKLNKAVIEFDNGMPNPIDFRIFCFTDDYLIHLYDDRGMDVVFDEEIHVSFIIDELDGFGKYEVISPPMNYV